jgi:NAD(P)-dependent dehydrogenase (short-subunit alcohol dehydrogenase family)
MSTQVVKTQGPFIGLPTYPDTPEFTNLTAIVTGANGMSGYHMVRVLAAAPERWSKIYCLSRRPPPENFFTDLGEGAKRVEHVSVDFLSDPEEIAGRLREGINKVYVLNILEDEAGANWNRDYVFFFSYMQPTQEGNILGMWSDAEELARINCETVYPINRLRG